LPMFYTWYNENSSFSPGRLDFMIYSDSVIDSVHSYVLFTPAMSTDSLVAHNLQMNDAILASDHLPLVADFILTQTNDLEFADINFPNKYNLSQNYPNPFNPKTSISYHLPVSCNVELTIYNAAGEKVAILDLGRKQAGSYKTEWDATGFSSGIYFSHLCGRIDYDQLTGGIILKKDIIVSSYE